MCGNACNASRQDTGLVGGQVLPECHFTRIVMLSWLCLALTGKLTSTWDPFGSVLRQSTSAEDHTSCGGKGQKDSDHKLWAAGMTPGKMFFE